MKSVLKVPEVNDADRSQDQRNGENRFRAEHQADQKGYDGWVFLRYGIPMTGLISPRVSLSSA
jgi:hypothetical protein